MAKFEIPHKIAYLPISSAFLQFFLAQKRVIILLHTGKTSDDARSFK